MADPRYLLLTLAFLGTSCSPFKPIAPIPTHPITTETRTPSQPTPSSTTPPSAAPSHTPATVRPSPTNKPTAQTLTPRGPWIAFVTEDEHIAVADFSGPGLQLLPYPSDSYPACKRISSLIASPQGGLLSFNCLTPTLDQQLWVVSLPSGSVLAQLTLLGAEAKEADSATPSGAISPWPATSAVQTFPPIWSPSGRYLAYSAAPESPSADVYIFDAATGTISHPTSDPEQTILLGWSPDSRRIVYATVPYAQVRTFVRTVWVASVDGSSTDKVYDVDKWLVHERIIGWESPNEVITARSEDEVCDTELRSTNIGSDSELLLAEAFPSAAFDPINGITAIAQETESPCFPEASLRPGIYSVNTDTKQVSKLSQSGYSSISWSSPLRAFMAASDSGSLDIVTSAGRVLASLPETSSIKPSPDGRWLLAYSDHGLSLLPSDGEPAVSSLSSGSPSTEWHPRSSSFLVVACDPCSGGHFRLHEYSLDADWKMTAQRDLPFASRSTEITLIPE